MQLALSSGYRMAPFSRPPSKTERRIYLRHDVGYSLEMAVRLAEVNAELGVRGTFCVLLRSQIYNLLSEKSMALVAQIHALGQEIGLHAPLGSMKERGSAEARLRSDFGLVKANLA